jgi:hypothetical protein
MALSQALAAILDWLRAGYPEGVPATDYVPLIALLRRQLSDAEVKEIVGILADEGDDISKVDIAVAILHVTDELPSQEDLHRVAARLARVGLPVPDDLHPES